jgi:acetyl esterase
MPLDPQVKSFIDGLAALNVPSIEEQPVAEARATVEARSPVLFGPTDPISSAEDRTLPGVAGPILVRIYRPLDADGPLPVLLYFHGGGWVVGSLESHDAIGRALANRSGCLVVAVDYRLAPEHRFPAAVDDAWAATQWVAEHAAEIGADARRIAVGGDSAGGNLAAVVAIRARERGIPLAFQLLIYPVMDYNLDSPSYLENAEGFYLTRDSMRWYWSQYLGDADGTHPEASPLRAADLRNLPPALLITCEYDPLRDEGEAYAERLRAAGVAVTTHRYDGLVHGVIRMPAIIDRARDMLDECAMAVRSALAGDAVR